MMISRRGYHSSPGSALQETDLQQIRFIHIFNSLALFAYRGGNRIQPDRTAAKGGDHRVQHLMVYAVQPARIDLQHLQRFTRNIGGDDSVTAHL